MPPNWREHLNAPHPRFGPPLAVAALFLVLPLALFASVTLGGRTLVPYDTLVSDPLFQRELAARGIEVPQNGLLADLVLQNLPWKQYLADSGRDGEVPLWNPSLVGGMPFLAAGQHSGLYPGSLLFLRLPPERAFGWNAVLTLWLAAVAMYVLGRTLGLSHFAATVMGLAWSLSSLFVVNTVFPMIQATMAWTPLVLAGIESAARAAAGGGAGSLLPRGRATLAVLVIGAATALAALAGHVEILYYSALVASTFALFRTVEVARSSGPGAAIRLVLWLVAAALAGGLLAGIQLVPLAELARTNWRGADSYATVVGFAYGLRQAVTFVLPDFYGNPAHHAVWDIVRGRQISLPGDAMWGTAWGTKNYVEAAAYVGLPALLLALIGLVAARRRGLVVFMAGLATVSLTFVFGLPTYHLLFSGLPGFNQLHSPFRWVFPYALAVVVLAGVGADRLARDGPARIEARWLGAAATATGALLSLGLGLAFLAPRSWASLVGAVLERTPSAREAILTRFADLNALASYEYWNLTHVALFLTLSGVAVLTLTRARTGSRQEHVGRLLALAVVALDLILIGYGFNPSIDPGLAKVRPAALAWLQDVTAEKWGRVVGYGPAKVLWPNTAMRFGIPDIRGYDSIMPWWTVETLDAIEDQTPPDGMLTYNRIGNLYRAESLAHPALAALGGRYVVTTARLDDPALKLVYEDEAVQIYENTRAMPQAWIVNQVEVYQNREDLLAALSTFDPATTVLLEAAPDRSIWRGMEAGRWVFRQSPQVLRDRLQRNGLEIEVPGATSGDILVLSEGWFPGWRAWVEVSTADGVEEHEVPVYRADGMLRAVPVPQGLSRVRLSYFPMSVKVGLYTSFLGAILLFLAVAYALWDRFVRVDRQDAVGLVAVNSAGPMAAALMNKVIDFAFAMLMLRVLGPENAGKYYTAIVIIGFAEIFTNFGLNLFAAREVARRPGEAPAYLTQTAVLRLILWALSLPLLALYIWFRSAVGQPLAADTVLAIALLAGALIPGNLNAALTSIFQAHERMILPAGVTIISTLLKVSLGALVLLAGYGFVGLAAVAIGVNWMTFAILAALAVRAGIRPGTSISRRIMWGMVGTSLPLMLNHLLQTVFFKIDVLLLDQIKGETVVGWYSAAYKWIDALLIIPAYFTMALFPLMSRRAEDDHAGLQRAYGMALRWLLSLALPIALVTTPLAETLVRILAGGEYLPHGATALQIMIWFLPLSFANGLTQYLLIALNRQRWITVSFAMAATFNVVANVIVIPVYSYPGAAVVTILSEVVLMVPFRWQLRDLDLPPFLVLIWRPALATSITALFLAGADAVWGQPIIAALLGVPVYAVALAALGGITPEDRALLARLWPRGRTRPAPSGAER